VKRIPRAAGLLGWTAGAVALNAAVPRELSRLGDHAGRPAPAPPAARGAGLLLVAAGTTLTGWAFATHYQAAPRGWALQAAPTPGYLLRSGPYRWSRNPMYAGEATIWAGWALFYASPAVWAGLVVVSAAFATIVPWEERRLLERFGEDYRAYLADVPRWVPRAPRRPRPPIGTSSGPTGIATTRAGGRTRRPPGYRPRARGRSRARPAPSRCGVGDPAAPPPSLPPPAAPSLD
jgi:protein-S-isoprenylcysteine O-methyltransferase Ste14